MKPLLAQQRLRQYSRASFRKRLLVFIASLAGCVIIFSLCFIPLKILKGKITKQQKLAERQIRIQRIILTGKSRAIYSNDLVKPEKVTALLNILLTATHGLTLTHTDMLETQKIGSLYLHGIQLTFNGTYKQVLLYLHELEKLPYRLYFHSIDYKVEKYPNAKIVLKINTLSRAKSWLQTNKTIQQVIDHVK